MFNDIAVKKEIAEGIIWKKLRAGVSVGSFPSSNPTTGFGQGQLYIKRYESENQTDDLVTVFLLHDLCQYHGRFIHFIEWMKEHCPSVSFVALDFVGHGLSSGTRGHFEKFDFLVNDFHNLLKFTPKKKNERWIVLGHGMGGLVTLDFINRFQESAGDKIDGLILSNFILKFQSLFLQMEEQILSEKNILKKIISQTRPARFYVGKDLLTEPLDVLTYEQDPLIIHRPTLNSVKELQYKTQTIYQDSYFIERPVLLLKSEFGTSSSVNGMDYFAKGIKKQLLTEKKYSLMKHDLYNERSKETVYSDIMTWINESSNE